MICNDNAYEKRYGLIIIAIKLKFRITSRKIQLEIQAGFFVTFYFNSLYEVF